MSHATVLVISNTSSRAKIKTLMAPYLEGLNKEFKAKIHEEEAEELLSEHNEEYRNKRKENYIYENIEDWMHNYHGYVKKGEFWGRWQNPDAKWDWWQIGGRYAGRIKVKEKAKGNRGETSWCTEGNPYMGNSYDQAQIKNIKEECLKNLTTFAVLNRDGWHEKSELGWFGIECYDGYCCIGNNIPMIDILQHFKIPPMGLGEPWRGHKNIYIDKFIKVLYKYYNFNKGKRVFSLKEEYSDGKITDIPDEDVRVVSFFRTYHWRDNFYERFIEPLNPNMWLTIVDYHI